MNNFTKEELLFMADGIVLIKSQCNMERPLRKKLDELDGKLCEMINEYCEHKSGTRINNEYHFKCDLCGKRAK